MLDLISTAMDENRGDNGKGLTALKYTKPLASSTTLSLEDKEGNNDTTLEEKESMVRND